MNHLHNAVQEGEYARLIRDAIAGIDYHKEYEKLKYNYEQITINKRPLFIKGNRSQK